MIVATIRRFAALVFLSFAVLSTAAIPLRGQPQKEEAKPYRVITSGKQVTIKSSKNIRNIMVWTATGHRLLEQRDVNNNQFSFTVNIREKVFYVMIQYDNLLKPYTERVGLP